QACDVTSAITIWSTLDSLMTYTCSSPDSYSADRVFNAAERESPACRRPMLWAPNSVATRACTALADLLVTVAATTALSAAQRMVVSTVTGALWSADRETPTQLSSGDWPLVLRRVLVTGRSSARDTG